jgi:glycosyltransferase involved in cell wall biosynthesis
LSEGAPRLLFVPVSGKFGTGEYSRSLAIAQGAASRWPGAALLFILSREAPYAATAPVPTELLDSSPTFHTGAVVDIIERWRPDVVIFDNAGRTAQLRAAKRAGARVVYISSRPRQRHKAFRLRWMRILDEHWIAYPRFIAGELQRMERLKLNFMHRPEVRFLDVILARPASSGGGEPRQSVLARLGVEVGEYVLVVPGGGTGHPGAKDAVGEFLEAAGVLAGAGVSVVFVGRAAVKASDGAGAGADAAGLAQDAAVAPEAGVTDGGRLHRVDSLPQSELAELMRGAQLVLVNGGSTLLQAIACGKACIAAPIAGDQPERIRRCVSAGVAVAAPLDSQALVRAAQELLGDDARLNALAGRAIALGLTDGVDVALRALTALLDGG